jgi:transcription antitermination protein NusB
LTRRRARELALQALFEIDLGQADPEFALAQAYVRDREDGGAALSDREADYLRRLVLGTAARIAEIDGEIVRLAKDWAVERMANVDRNVLRLAIYELRHEPEVPVSAVINEAVELVKEYSTAESSRFVNGILGSLVREGERGEPHVQTLPRD